MAITKIVETQKGRSGGVTLSSGYEAHHVRTWTAISTDGTDGDLAVRLAVQAYAGLNLGDAYRDQLSTEFDNFSFCDSIEASASDNLTWTVTATYNKWNPDYNQINPISNRPRVSIEWQQEEEVVEVDLEGNPVVASNGLPFDPAPVRNRSIAIIRIEQNRPSFDRDLLFGYKDAVNQDYFLGFDPGTVKVLNITTGDDYDPTAGKYWKYNFEFAVDQNGWKRKLLDSGFYALDTSVTPYKYKKILINGDSPTQPCPLDGAGGVLTPPVDSSNQVQLEFKWYPEADLALATGFDTSIWN